MVAGVRFDEQRSGRGRLRIRCLGFVLAAQRPHAIWERTSTLHGSCTSSALHGNLYSAPPLNLKGCCKELVKQLGVSC